jgi:hypothetical protein
VTYSTDDPMASAAVFDTATNIDSYLKYTMTTADTSLTANNVVVLNLDVLGNLKNMNNEVKIYMWVTNDNSADAILKVRGCATSTCRFSGGSPRSKRSTSLQSCCPSNFSQEEFRWHNKSHSE